MLLAIVIYLGLMRNRFLLSLIAVFAVFIQPAAAQEADYGRFQIRWMPLRTIDPINPGVELHAEAALHPRFSIQLAGAGIFFVVPVEGERDPQTLRGGRGLMGFKYYFDDKGWSKRNITRGYLMMEGGYSQVEFWRMGEFSAERNPDPIFGPAVYRELYRTRRGATLINLRVGVQICAGRFVTDASAGIGVRYVEVDHIGRTRPTDELVSGSTPGLRTYREQSSTWPNIPFALSLGYRFGR